ncbi:hypothetical protein QJS10_CPA01g01967 [Acorus calamus]|uniref:Uncharacterized protein n=1 Tax=Acorus calamus TaxID=4465 RepID=A0AAV9FFQ4_ACOCL|nr:hypothetical protein QJS10_CPA01g01967 [Acorus calamus]
MEEWWRGEGRGSVKEVKAGLDFNLVPVDLPTYLGIPYRDASLHGGGVRQDSRIVIPFSGSSIGGVESEDGESEDPPETEDMEEWWRGEGRGSVKEVKAGLDFNLVPVDLPTYLGIPYRDASLHGGGVRQDSRIVIPFSGSSIGGVESEDGESEDPPAPARVVNGFLNESIGTSPSINEACVGDPVDGARGGFTGVDPGDGGGGDEARGVDAVKVKVHVDERFADEEIKTQAGLQGSGLGLLTIADKTEVGAGFGEEGLSEVVGRDRLGEHLMVVEIEGLARVIGSDEGSDDGVAD